ncbi:MAG: sigma-54 dependent transcriptional regulator [Bacteroidota bacterium]
MKKGSVLLVDDEQNILKTVTICLESAGFEVDAFLNPIQARDALQHRRYDLAFFDLKMQPIDGIQLLKDTRQASPGTTVVLMTAHGSIDTAVEAIKLGAHDYLQKPFEFSELQHFSEKVYEHHRLRQEVVLLKEELHRLERSGEIVTRNERMKEVIELALRVAQSGISVLIEGESGTGKELLAHLIHENSGRQEGPFVTVNCSALAETLLESELFGHVKGSFTGAVKDRQGRFDAADGGTVFLDEVGEIPQPTQVKLLRFLQSKELERVGESTTRKVDVRVIAATNRDLEEAVQSGVFREDLYYRLNAVKLRLPPLRDRTEDIPLLMQHFLLRHRGGHEVSPEVLEALTGYPWKGNVRELENVMERAVILARGDSIHLQHLPEEFHSMGEGSRRPLSLREVEQQHIIKVLRVSNDLEEAARTLGIAPTTLWRKRKKYSL